MTLLLTWVINALALLIITYLVAFLGFGATCLRFMWQTRNEVQVVARLCRRMVTKEQHEIWTLRLARDNPTLKVPEECDGQDENVEG